LTTRSFFVPKTLPNRVLIKPRNPSAGTTAQHHLDLFVDL